MDLLGNLRALCTLDLSDNNLEGPVPESLINLPSLQILNISFNRLYGTLPVGQSTSNLGIADFSYNNLTLTTVHLPSVHRLNLSNNNYKGKGELLDIELNSDGAFVDLRGNSFQCAYPTNLPNKVWDKCIIHATVFYFMAGLIFAVVTRLVYVMYRNKGVMELKVKDAPATCRSKTLAMTLWIRTALALVLPWADTVSDFQFNLEIQNYIQSQKQFDCDMFNQKGMFDPSGFTVNGAPYPNASDYGNFQVFVTELMIKFPLDLLQTKIEGFKTNCFGVNLPGAPPDCTYVTNNVTTFVCVQDPAWVPPGKVFGSACAHHSRDPQPLLLCRYVVLALFVFIMFKELVKVGVVLFLLVRRGGKVPSNLRRSSCLVVVIARSRNSTRPSSYRKL